MISLALDASTYRATVAVIRDGDVLADVDAAMRGATDERLMPAVADVIARAGIRAAQLDRVVCGAGPGSFTSLRIAASIAKGLATGLRIPLFSVPSLALAAAGAPRAAGALCAVMDALRGDLYAAVYALDVGGAVNEIEPARVLPANAVEAFAAARNATVLPVGVDGDPASAWPRARAVVHALALVERAGAVDVATWEPAYGRLAEAQVKWEAAHGRPMAST